MATKVTVGAMPANVDLLLYQGDDFFLTLVVTEADGSPVDLTGYTPLSQIRSTPASSTILAVFATTLTLPNSVNLHLTHVESLKLTGSASWDVEITSASGLVSTLAYGAIKLTAEVTR